MRILRRYEHHGDARAAAVHLLEHGVVAAVVFAHLRQDEWYPGLTWRGTGAAGEFRLMLARDDDLDHAEALLEAFAGIDAAAELGDGWEAAAEPDLSRLDPAAMPDCPGCGRRLPRVRAGERIAACGSCGARADVGELIFERDGPEGLAACYPEPTPENAAAASGGVGSLSDSAIRALRLACARCGYPLDGLPMTGHCPECGHDFEKRALVGRLLGE